MSLDIQTAAAHCDYLTNICQILCVRNCAKIRKISNRDTALTWVPGHILEVTAVYENGGF